MRQLRHETNQQQQQKTLVAVQCTLVNTVHGKLYLRKKILNDVFISSIDLL